MMQRREMLKGLLGLGALLGGRVLGATAAKGTGPVLLTVPIRGHRYHDGPRVLRSLQIGRPLQLMREADNDYDEDAVAVHAGEAHLGYLPREYNTVVAHLLDQGTPINATLVELDLRDSYAPCMVELRLTA